MAENEQKRGAGKRDPREANIKRSEECRDEIVAVLIKYNAQLAYHSGSAYSSDHGCVELIGVDNIPGANIEIVYSDWSM